MAKKKQSFEEVMSRIEEIVELMEDNETPLEKSVELYKEGIELSVYCSEILNSSKEKVKVLSKNIDGEIKETDFMNSTIN